MKLSPLATLLKRYRKEGGLSLRAMQQSLGLHSCEILEQWEAGIQAIPLNNIPGITAFLQVDLLTSLIEEVAFQHPLLGDRLAKLQQLRTEIQSQLEQTVLTPVS